MTELPQATSRRELRERERAAEAFRSRSRGGRRGLPSRVRRGEKSRLIRSGATVTRTGKTRNSRAHTIGSRLLSVAAMLFAGALVIGMSVPANAFYPASSNRTSTPGASSSTAGQSVAVASDETVDVGARDQVSVMSWAQVLAEKYSHAGSAVGRKGHGSIRWPFPYAVTISSPFGPRAAPCYGCSTFHDGVDFTPGSGAAIFAVTDGVVTTRDDGTSTYGNYIIVTARVKGHTVKETYAHMTRASSPIVLGQTVRAGEFLGLVGMTGEATGPHMHFEINVDGTTIDPIPWLEANVN
jgi:murein DD-endopeptidase MepM/ murein hydrolase activator NlpD